MESHDTDECAANMNGHRYGAHGPKGEQQCQWCGAAPPTLADFMAKAEQGTLTHGELVTIMLNGARKHGYPTSSRAELLAQVRERFATSAEVSTFTRQAFKLFTAGMNPGETLQ